MVLATFAHAMRQDKKVAFMALYPEGQALANAAIATIGKRYPEKKYGVDFVNLGYKAGNEAPLVSLGLDLRGERASKDWRRRVESLRLSRTPPRDAAPVRSARPPDPSLPGLIHTTLPPRATFCIADGGT